jgi:hypothetical protein
VKCRAGRPLCAKARAPYLCHCPGVTWSGGKPRPELDQASARRNDEIKAHNPPHRRGSRCGKFGVCEHHKDHAALMWAQVDEPVRKRA